MSGVDGKIPAKVPGRDSDPRPLPKRFYTTAEAGEHEGRHVVLLDARVVKTPGKRLLAVETAALAAAIAAEWAAQGERIDPATMPLTRLANTTIDGVAPQADAVRADIVKYAGSDLVCYRATFPAELAAAQARAWDPVLTWAQSRLGARFFLADGVMPVAQLPEALARVEAHVAPFGPFRLAAAHVMTTLTGSALLALATLDGALDAEAAWSAAHVDEDYQISQWGEDAEAKARRAKRHDDMKAAARLVALAG